MTVVNSVHHQYSLRLARPSNFAYFLNPRQIAPPNPMPYCGQSNENGYIGWLTMLRSSRLVGLHPKMRSDAALAALIFAGESVDAGPVHP